MKPKKIYGLIENDQICQIQSFLRENFIFEKLLVDWGVVITTHFEVELYSLSELESRPLRTLENGT